MRLGYGMGSKGKGFDCGDGILLGFDGRNEGNQ